ncbi:MAG: AAA family ATPase [Alteromonadales bacterium]|nr:AAA family ATPase [Alteromonadales bacterium]
MLANNNSASTGQKISRLSPKQCATDFLTELKTTQTNSSNWLDVFPITSQVINHFFQLSQPLLFINAQYWHTARAVVETCNSDNNEMLCLQNYDQARLFGRINLINNEQVKAQLGEIVKLNGGVLVLHISPLLVDPSLWFLLKAFLLNQRIPSNAAVNSDKLHSPLPEPTSETINTKIILVANRYQLDELAQIDPDFSQISSLFAELSGEISSSSGNIQALHQYCLQLIRKKGLTELTNEAFNTLFTYLSRLCEHQNKLLFSAQVIESTLHYAQLLQQRGVKTPAFIDATDIQQALDIQDRAQSNAQQFSDQALVEKQLNIQLQGEKVGQINGLSVVELMGYPTEFGEIFRISASDMIGDGEIIDVERKVELAGNVHAKSTLIVQGYLNHFFTHINNFPLSCNVVFEQSYQESDGDSASLAILLAVISCYSETPIKQNLFVTGALDQHGNVLAIGGINQKIESITRLFKLQLLNEPVTVLMPQANQINLMLNSDTLQLIEDKKINIYPLQHCQEAFSFAMSQEFETVINNINKRILYLHKEDDDEPQGLITKWLNLLR